MGCEIDLLNREIDVLRAEVAAAREGRLPRAGPSGTDRVPANPQEPARGVAPATYAARAGAGRAPPTLEHDRALLSPGDL